MTVTDLTEALSGACARTGLSAGKVLENAVHETPHTLWSISDESLTKAIWDWMDGQEEKEETP